jgi:hypothetical protein
LNARIAERAVAPAPEHYLPFGRGNKRAAGPIEVSAEVSFEPSFAALADGAAAR